MRAVEEIVAMNSGVKTGTKSAPAKVTNLRAREIQNELADKLDTRVTVELGKAKGKIVIEIADLTDLERINKLI